MGAAVGLIFTAVLLIAIVAWTVFSRQRRDAAWKQLGADLGAEFIAGGAFKSSKVQARVKQGTITLDTYSVPSGDSSTTYTRLRAPFQNPERFEFRVFREGIVGKLDKALGMKDLEIGVSDFDDDFIIQSNNETRVRALLSNTRIRQLIQAQRAIRLYAKNNELLLEAQGVIRDLERLKSLFELFTETLNDLQP